MQENISLLAFTILIIILFFYSIYNRKNLKKRKDSIPYIGLLVSKKYVNQAIIKLLNPDEKLLGIFKGLALAQSGYLYSTPGNDYMLVTDKRIVFWVKGKLSENCYSFLYMDILSVESARRRVFGELALQVNNIKQTFNQIANEDVLIALNLINKQIEHVKTLNT